MLRLLNPILLNVILSFYSFKKYFEDLRVQVHKISNIFTVINMDLPARNVVVQSLSRVWLFVTPWTAASQASLSITNSWSLLKLMSIESVMPSNHLILCPPLLLPNQGSNLTRDQTHMPCLGRRSLSYWTTRETLLLCFHYGSSYVHFKPPKASSYSLYPAPWLLGFPGGSVVKMLGLKSATLWQ